MIFELYSFFHTTALKLFTSKVSFLLRESRFQFTLIISLSRWTRANFFVAYHCVKSVCIRSFPGPYFPVFGLNIKRLKSLRKKSPYSELFWSTFFSDFPAFGLNTERYGLYLRIQSECGKIREKCGPDNSEYGRFLRRGISPYSVLMRENTEQRNCE